MNVTVQNTTFTSARGDTSSTAETAQEAAPSSSPATRSPTTTRPSPPAARGTRSRAARRGPPTWTLPNNDISATRTTNALTVIKSRDPSANASGNLQRHDRPEHDRRPATGELRPTLRGRRHRGHELRQRQPVAGNHQQRRPAVTTSGMQYVAGGGIAETGLFNLNSSGNTTSTPGNTLSASDGGFPPRAGRCATGSCCRSTRTRRSSRCSGTTFGGDGRVNFALPDLRGPVPIHVGSGHTLGERGGEQAHTLSIAELPTHTHVAQRAARRNGRTQSRTTFAGEARPTCTAAREPA